MFLSQIVQVLVKKEWVHSTDVTFPAVTLCNTNPVKQSLLHLSPRMSALVNRWASSQDRKKRRKRDTSTAKEVRAKRCEFVTLFHFL